MPVLRFAVVGNPVSHSKSPRIHQLFAEQTGKELAYERMEVDAPWFERLVRDFFARGGTGLNITVPFKEKAYNLADTCSERAAVARAVNTLYIDDKRRLSGDNTDGVGLLRDLRNNQGQQIRGANILVLGAGGAVRGVLGALAGESPGSITLVNRTAERARQLQKDFKPVVELEVIRYDSPIEKPFDIVINGTSMGLKNEVPPLSSAAIGPRTCCYDMMYGKKETTFVTWARLKGAGKAVDGLGMLVEQAAESFRIWMDVRPATRPVIEQLRSELGKP